MHSEKGTTQQISLRIENDVVEIIKVMAEEKGLSFARFIRNVLIDFTKESRQNCSSDPIVIIKGE